MFSWKLEHAYTAILNYWIQLHIGPDHLSALATVSVGQRWKAFKLGVQWGIGHSMGLLLIFAIFRIMQEQLNLGKRKARNSLCTNHEDSSLFSHVVSIVQEKPPQSKILVDFGVEIFKERKEKENTWLIFSNKICCRWCWKVFVIYCWGIYAWNRFNWSISSNSD